MAKLMTYTFVRDHLSAEKDQTEQFPVHYGYDYLSRKCAYLQPPSLTFSEQLEKGTFLPDVPNGEEPNEKRGSHAIDIYPKASGLPWPTGIQSCRQSKYWQLTLDVTRQFLELFATEDFEATVSKSGKTLSELARKELLMDLAEGWAKFPVYLFSEGDQQRTKLLAAVNVFIFIFDDFWEMHDMDAFSHIQDAFISRMRPNFSGADNKSPLLRLIDNTITDILQLDQETGNSSGKEMIEAMVRFFTRPPPPESYKDMDDFLLYRHEDAAVPYVLACTKFALNSTVDLGSPRLAHYIRLIKDHVSIANDLGSWEKEKSAYDNKSVLYMINAVDTAKQILNLRDFDAAVSIATALQYQIECEIDTEIQKLLVEGELTAEEKQLIDSTLHVMSGNIFVSTVMSRYGGEKYRLGE